MAEITMKNIVKRYGDGFQAVNDVSLEIADGEFVILVGPSGCGKSTLLRMIVGLEDITSGDMVIGGKRVNNLAPRDRNLAMVFQNYALYPHLSVAENIAFGLRLRKAPKAEIEEKIQWAAKMLDLTPYLARRPKELSGGQRQRVAMGRAIVRQPQRERDVLVDGQVRVEGVVLEDHREVAVPGREVVHDPVPDQHLARGDVLEADDHPQQRRLPAARRPDEDHALAVLHVDGDVVHRREPVAVLLDDVLHVDGSHRVIPSLRRR